MRENPRSFTTTAPSPKAQAAAAALSELAKTVERYGPVKRARPGVGGVCDKRFGVDLVDHEAPGQPLSRVGVLVTAVDLIRRWETVVGDEYKKAIDKSMQPPPTTTPQTTKGVGPVALLKTAFLPVIDTSREEEGRSLERSSHVTAMARHCSAESSLSGNVIASRRYLHHLELENIVYRRHLQDFEFAITDRFLRVIDGIVQGKLDEGGVPKCQASDGTKRKMECDEESRDEGVKKLRTSE
ncbi:MAG: hypothetical protein M1837_002844 [Sclerophora amabilis]|nr:MAG: hypothetical protein M1837_002844 [Sclerophora amabilis]